MMQRRLLTSMRSSPLVNASKRQYQLWTKNYTSGFDRMLLDKLNFTGVQGYWFAAFGVANLLAYGLHLYMTPDRYNYHFAYKGEGGRSIFRPFKAMMGSDTLANVVWTAPTLILLNLYLQPKVGSLVLTKLFALTYATSFIFWSAFNPASGLNVRPLQGIPMKFDSYDDKGKHFMGSDTFCQSIIYFTILYHRMWYVALPIMLYDTLYYGPSTLGGPIAALGGALIFL